MKQAFVALLKGFCKALRAVVLIPLLALFIAFLLVVGLLVGGAIATLIGLLIAASITIGGTVMLLQAMAR